MKPFNVGDRVEVTVDAGWIHLEKAKGTIVFMDYSSGIYSHEFCPVQIELDEPYEHQRLIRVTVREIQRCED